MAELDHRHELEALDLVELAERAAELAGDALSPQTRRAYRTTGRVWRRFCDRHGVDPTPTAETAAIFAAALLQRGRKVSTVRRHLAAVATAARALGLPSPYQHPDVRRLLRGAARRYGTAPERAPALRLADLAAVVEGCDRSLAGHRDRCLVLLGWAGALRRSELAALDWSNVAIVEGGLEVQITASKGDPEGQGRTLPIPYAVRPALCPVRALRSWASARVTAAGCPIVSDGERYVTTGTVDAWGCWLEDLEGTPAGPLPVAQAAAAAAGPLFVSVDRHGRPGDRLSPRAVGEIVTRACERVGLEGYTGHSLRAGWATSAAAAGVPEAQIAQITGHRSVRVLRGYTSRGRLWEGVPRVL